MGQYFEDFVPGSVFETRSRTVTEADIVNFAGLSGDFVELHMSEEYASRTPFGHRIAHGMLVLSIAAGLSSLLNLTYDTVLALYGIDKLRFTRPVFIGDTIRVRKSVATTEPKEKGGLVTFETTVLNQNGETVLVYSDKLLVRKRS